VTRTFREIQKQSVNKILTWTPFAPTEAGQYTRIFNAKQNLDARTGQ